MSRDDDATMRHADRVRYKRIKAAQDGRDGKTHVPVPHVVLDSPGWLLASSQARALLLDIVAPLFRGGGGAEPGRPNGGLMIEWEERLVPRGWRSKSVVTKLLRELVTCGLLCLTRQGGRRCPGLYAATWLGLGTGRDYQLDIDPSKWGLVHRGAYMRPEKPADRPKVDRAAKAREARAAKRAQKNDSPGLSDRGQPPGNGLSDSQRKSPNRLSHSPKVAVSGLPGGLSDSRSLEHCHLQRESAGVVAMPQRATRTAGTVPQADRPTVAARGWVMPAGLESDSKRKPVKVESDSTKRPEVESDSTVQPGSIPRDYVPPGLPNAPKAAAIPACEEAA